MNKIKTAASTAKNKVHTHFTTHKTKYAVAATAVAAYKVHAQAVGEWNQFLEEKGLKDEFYNPRDELGNEL